MQRIHDISKPNSTVVLQFYADEFNGTVENSLKHNGYKEFLLPLMESLFERIDYVFDETHANSFDYPYSTEDTVRLVILKNPKKLSS